MLIEFITAMVAAFLTPYGQLHKIYDLEKNDTFFDAEQFEEKIIAQQSAVEANEVLFATFEKGIDTFIYPSDYAGDYIADDFKLHVLLTDEKAVEKYECVLSDYSEIITIDIVEHSFNELFLIAEEFAHSLPEGSWCTCGVDTINNKGSIDIVSSYADYLFENFDLNYDKTIGKYVYDDILILNFDCSRAEAQTSYYAGHQIDCGTNSGTLGGSGMHGSNIALVTAGHVPATVNTSAYIGSSYVGNVSVRSFDNYVYGDYAIIYGAAGVTKTNGIFAGGGNVAYISGSLFYPPVGMYVNKYGAFGQAAYCRITSVGYNGNVYYDDTHFKEIYGLTKAEVINGNSLAGDSGGPYWNNGNYCGIHSSFYTTGFTDYVCFTPYYYLYNAGFNISTS